MMVKVGGGDGGPVFSSVACISATEIPKDLQ